MMNPLWLFRRKDITPLRKLLLMHAAAGGGMKRYTETGNPVTFNTNVEKPVEVEVQINPMQSGSGDPAPDNIRPITGWTGANVYRTGKNLLKTKGLTAGSPSSTSFSKNTNRTFTIGTYVTNLSATNYYNAKVTQASVTENSISVTTDSAAYALAIPLTGLKIGATYAFSATKTNGKTSVSFYKQDGTYIMKVGDNPTNFTVPAETYYTLLCFFGTTDGVQATFTDIQLEFGSSASSYEPYVDFDSYPVSWQSAAGTVYGGTLNLKTGILTVTHKLLTLTGNEGITYSVYGQTLYTGDSSLLADSAAGTQIYGYCSMVGEGVYTTGIDKAKLAKAYSDRGLQFYQVIDYWGLSESTSAALIAQLQAWNTAGTPLQIVYELETPIEYTLTPQEIETLLGDNVIFTDLNSDMTIKYLKKG